MKFKELTLKILKLFIISLPLIAFGITIGNDTLPLSFLILFILGVIILTGGQPIIIDTATKILFAFFILAFISVCYRLLVTTETVISSTGEMMDTKGFKQLIMFFFMILHFLIIQNILRKYDIETIQRIIQFFILVSFFISLYSIYQFFAFKYDWPFTDILRTSKSYSITRGLETSSWIGLPRARAFMPEPSFWGTFLLVPFSLILPFAFKRKRMSLLLFVFIIAQFLTFSRSCWFGFLLILSLLVFYKVIYQRKLIGAVKISFVMLLLAFLLTAMIVPQKAVLFKRLFTFTDPSAVERFEMQKKTFQMFLKNPIVGVGFGNTPFFIEHQVTHDWYLQLLLETGIIGFFLFILFLFQVWSKFKKIERKVNKMALCGEYENLTSLISGLKLSFFSILFTWVSLPAYNLSYIWFLFALITALPNVYKNVNLLSKET